MVGPLTEEDRALLKRVSRYLNEAPTLLWAGALAGWFDEIASMDRDDSAATFALARKRLSLSDALNLETLAGQGPDERSRHYRHAAAIVRGLLDLPQAARET